MKKLRDSRWTTLGLLMLAATWVAACSVEVNTGAEPDAAVTDGAAADSAVVDSGQGDVVAAQDVAQNDDVGASDTEATPVVLPATADGYVYAYTYRNWDKANLGGYHSLRAGWHPTGGESRAYIRFDLSKLPAGAIAQAELRLFHFQTKGSAKLEVGVFRVTGDWKEGTGVYHSGQVEKTAAPGELSWVQQPAFDKTVITKGNPGMGLGDWTTFDVTDLVKAWRGGQANHGLVLKALEPYTAATGESVYHFASRERDASLDAPKGTAKGPVLLVTFVK